VGRAATGRDLGDLLVWADVEAPGAAYRTGGETMTTKTEPGSCPYCEDSDGVIVEKGITGYHVQCDDCSMRGPFKHDKVEAIVAWNRIHRRTQIVILKPCPFCGAVNLRIDDAGPSAVSVMCLECRVEGPPADTGEQAGQLWNRRASD
jgi:Lar family restriction alleviation protein